MAVGQGCRCRQRQLQGRCRSCRESRSSAVGNPGTAGRHRVLRLRLQVAAAADCVSTLIWASTGQPPSCAAWPMIRSLKVRGPQAGRRMVPEGEVPQGVASIRQVNFRLVHLPYGHHRRLAAIASLHPVGTACSASGGNQPAGNTRSRARR
jgi:hypothetical protein